MPELEADEIAVEGRKGESGNRKVHEPPVEITLVDRAEDFGRKMGNAGHELLVERAGLDLILKFSHVSCRPLWIGAQLPAAPCTRLRNASVSKKLPETENGNSEAGQLQRHDPVQGPLLHLLHSE